MAGIIDAIRHSRDRVGNTNVGPSNQAEINRHLRRRGIKPGALRTDLRLALIDAVAENEDLRAENDDLRKRLSQAGGVVPPVRPPR